MTIDQLEIEVNKNLFESDIKLYEESIKLIISFFKQDKEKASEELIDLMQEVLDNKNTTYVKGDFTIDQKNEIVNFVEYQWNISLVKMKLEGKEEIKIDSTVSHLLDILSFIAPLKGKVKTSLEEFLLEENNEKYRDWIQSRLSNF